MTYTCLNTDPHQPKMSLRKVFWGAVCLLNFKEKFIQSRKACWLSGDKCHTGMPQKNLLGKQTMAEGDMKREKRPRLSIVAIQWTLVPSPPRVQVGMQFRMQASVCLDCGPFIRCCVSSRPASNSNWAGSGGGGTLFSDEAMLCFMLGHAQNIQHMQLQADALQSRFVLSVAGKQQDLSKQADWRLSGDRQNLTLQSSGACH